MSNEIKIKKRKNCPLCNAKNSEISILMHENWELVKCSDCSFVYMPEVPVYEMMKEEFAWEKNFSPSKEIKLSKKIRRSIKGLIKRNDNNIIDFLDVICQSTNQNSVVTWRKFERTGSEIGRGVGVSTIIDTTSKYKKQLIGTKCNYAVNRTKDMVFSKAVCKVSDELYKKLTQ